MDLKNLFADDDAVSPVIGVILMVAITVILAAVIGAFVLDLGSSQESAPQLSFDFEDDGSGTVDITVEAGESIDGDRLETTSDGGGSVTGDTWSDYTEVNAGDSVTFDGTSGETIRIVWTSESGDSSSTLADYEIQ